VLDESPEPFATASSEKRAALSHFQPQGVLISHGAARADRRRYNEQVLEADRPVHQLAEHFGAVVNEEAALLLAAVRHREVLDWDDFALTWFRVVRRVTLGDAARDDHTLTALLDQLRADANWAFFKPKRRHLRVQFDARLRHYLQRAEPHSLAGVMAATPHNSLTAPQQQVPQWLFAFDPAGMATIRALALLAAHPQRAEQARQEIQAQEGQARRDLPFLRACVLESLRLWPTTPMLLRQTTRPTSWEAGALPARTGMLIFAPFFHRDDRRLPEADRFAPELWLERQAQQGRLLIPFSGGPAICPGRNLVLLLGSLMLATLLDGREARLVPPSRIEAGRPLPATLSPYRLRFELRERVAPFKPPTLL
jgi:cytochrome P450